MFSMFSWNNVYNTFTLLICPRAITLHFNLCEFPALWDEDDVPDDLEDELPKDTTMTQRKNSVAVSDAECAAGDGTPGQSWQHWLPLVPANGSGQQGLPIMMSPDSQPRAKREPQKLGLRGAHQGQEQMDCEVRRRGGPAKQHRVCQDPGHVQDDLSQDLLHPARGGSVVPCTQVSAAIATRHTFVATTTQLQRGSDLTNSSQSSPTSWGLKNTVTLRPKLEWRHQGQDYIVLESDLIRLLQKYLTSQILTVIWSFSSNDVVKWRNIGTPY